MVFFVAGWYLYGQLMVNGFDYVLKYGPVNGFTIFVMAFVVWLAGLLFIAGPLWWLLHRSNNRGWKSAVVLGFTLTFFVTLFLSTQGFGLMPAPEGSTFSASDSGGPTWINNELTRHGWIQALWSSFWFALVGVCSALVTWGVAYRAKSKAESF